MCGVTMGHLRVTVGHLRVTIGHPRVTIGHLRLTIGYLMATVVHIRVTLGHLRVIKGHFLSISKHKANTTVLHPKVRQTCIIYFYVLIICALIVCLCCFKSFTAPIFLSMTEISL